MIRKVSAEDIPLEGMRLAWNICAPLGTLSTFFFNTVFQVSTAKNEINLFNNHILIVAPVTFAPAGAMTPSAEFLFYIYISNFRSQITYSFVKCGCSIYCFPHSQLWYVEVRISRSVSVSPLEFEITRVHCTCVSLIYITFLFVQVQLLGRTRHFFFILSSYSRISMARTSLGPWKFVRDMGSSSHWGLIMAPVQEANSDDLGKSFRFSTQWLYVECTH